MDERITKACEWLNERTGAKYTVVLDDDDELDTIVDMREHGGDVRDYGDPCADLHAVHLFLNTCTPEEKYAISITCESRFAPHTGSPCGGVLWSQVRAMTWTAEQLWEGWCAVCLPVAGDAQ